MLIAFAGCDGCGKSTAVQHCSDSLTARGYGVEILDKWDTDFGRCLYGFGDSRCDREGIRRCVGEMQNPSRAIFIFWMISMSVTRLVTSNIEKIYLLDGYWMKHAAAELELGCSEGLIMSLVSSLPKADMTFLFDVDPAIAAARKNGAFSIYECGLSAGVGVKEFLMHQAKVRNRLAAWGGINEWIIVDASEAIEDVAINICAAINSSLDSRKTACVC